MPVSLVRAPALSDDVPYAYAAVTPAGALVFTAGACPLDEAGEVVAPGDVVAQARQVMVNLVTALEACGAGLVDVAKSTVYVASDRREDLVARSPWVAEACTRYGFRFSPRLHVMLWGARRGV